MKRNQYVVVECLGFCSQQVLFPTAQANECLMKLNSVCKLKFVLPAETSRFLYERVIPMLLYGAIVWCKTTKLAYIRKYFLRTQRLACLLIRGCFQTSSTEALKIPACLIPFEHVIDERAAVQYFSILSELVLLDKLSIHTESQIHSSANIHESPLQFAKRFWKN